MYFYVTAFMNKLLLFSEQLQNNRLDHFETLKQVNLLKSNKERYVVQLNDLHSEFTRRFSDFRKLKNEFTTVSAPFSISANNAPSEVQLELIDLQADPRHAFNFRIDEITNFYSSLDEHSFYKLRSLAKKMLVFFGSTYICEQAFSTLKFNKSKIRSVITDAHLADVMRITTSDRVPNYSSLVINQEESPE